MKRNPFITFVFVFYAFNAFAGDRDFTYTYQSTVLGKGHRELELWFTYKTGKNIFYNALDHRAEFEIGLGKNIQTAFYLNLGYSSSSSFVELNPDVYTIESSKGLSLGFSNEWKWKLSDPVANAVGSALYAEVSVEPGEFELEGKVILDKKIGNFITAFNLEGEIEFEAEPELHFDESGIVSMETEWEKGKKVELNYGLTYAFNNSFSAGFEVRNHNVFKEGVWEHSALYAGPVISIKQETWWLAFTALPQITDLKGDGLDLNDHEKLQSRVLLGFHF
ncbi:MAG: hypothetical protein ACKVPJ_11760 [Chitinophagales bacterium]